MAITLNSLRPALLACIVAFGAAVPVPAETPSLAMLDRLEIGLWELRQRGGTATVRSFCVGEPRSFIQIQHPRASCSRYVIADGDEEVTVHYTCPGAGHGRTTIRHETNRLVQIDTQGIASGAPFSFAYEARRAGPCTQ